MQFRGLWTFLKTGKKNSRKKAKRLRTLLSDCEYIDKELLDETEDKNLWDFLENDDVFDYVYDIDESLLDKVSDEFRPSEVEFEVDRRMNAMQIKFADENIRVFPEEYSEVTLENMKTYLEFYIFHETDLWNGLGNKPSDPDEKFIFEAALLDGCNDYQATNILNGGNADSVDDFPAPLGWYECPKEVGLAFFSEEDLTPRYKDGGSSDKKTA